jgi:nucleoside 2-deoxyribosyltransferase
LHTYVDDSNESELRARVESFGNVSLYVERVDRTISFDYVHPLSVPHIQPPPHLLPEIGKLQLTGDIILRFGMMEGDAVVRGRRVTYDPQSAYRPTGFSANGSEAEHLAIVANGYEVRALTGKSDALEGARELLRTESAEIVVVKQGSKGALVVGEKSQEAVSAYRSEAVFSIGSGDIFAAAFAYFWGECELEPTEAADLASRSTALYCESRSAPLRERVDLLGVRRETVKASEGRVYLAGPFFTLGERWLVEESRAHLRGMGLGVFSPIHDIGPGPASVVGPADLVGLKDCDRVLALIDGTDPGTLFEVGYARALGLPVVALAETLSEEQLKMVEGSDCQITDDFATAIYLTAWS